MIGQLRTMYAQNQVMVNGCAGLNSLHSFLSLYMQKDLLSRGLSITHGCAPARKPLSLLSLLSLYEIKEINELSLLET
jgi:hypothetical protein